MSSYLRSNPYPILLILGTALLFFSSQTVAAKDEVTIAVLYWSVNIPGQVAMAKGLEKKVDALNQRAEANELPHIKLITRVAGDDIKGVERQIVQMTKIISLKPDMIIVQPTDNAALAEPLKLANKHNIPVVAYDQYISGGKLTAYVTSNNHQAGYLNGEYVASLYPSKQKIKLILVEYPLVSSTVERLNGFLDALRDYKQSYQILNTYQAVEPVSGTKAGKAIIADFPEQGSIDVIFTVNDGGGLNVVNELVAAGRNEIVVATVDGDPASVKNIQAGRLTHIDTAQFCGAMGAQALLIAYDILLGQTVPSLTLIPVYPITQKTLINYPGWSGNIPQTFKKPWLSHQPYWNNKFKLTP
ncbi:sugar ABC transporter substrate-binding protein [Candidatus Venteria ishoeyi]|uniref:D-ribose-binding periplasmic protein n=1 Tax=Candidatus Venteria ishoeyi TaxID=1899563 RepID=A0A1H6F986_9GAMM|nr:sugar ABC transporter substrate-binding protein [Candidatus Venteria ishoeyi]MDM8547633.1 sugar ABC transporter substrate-binding protein [Candidatus Venteria ishoeyi]SEH06163.1 D-ribose-binding periplasmic protein precursor [Candidatus Venteria ishoeyi]